MGLFDFLKKKDIKNEQNSANSTQSNTNAKYLGDLEKTKIIRGLCNVPIEKRDDTWQNNFLSNVATASFQCGKPQIIQGPDGMQYFQLSLPEPNKEFECFVIERMTSDYLLNEGLGVALNVDKGEPDWVFSNGDIVNYSINKEFLTKNTFFLEPRASDEVLQTNARVRVGQPSESILPLQTRKVISSYLKKFGLDPKICLIEWLDKGSKFDIVFNIVPDMFENKEDFSAIMSTVKWFFPRHYSIICKDEDGNFEPL